MVSPASKADQPTRNGFLHLLAFTGYGLCPENAFLLNRRTPPLLGNAQAFQPHGLYPGTLA
jgi:hypothetical protein